jgi:hypothetical protein
MTERGLFKKFGRMGDINSLYKKYEGGTSAIVSQKGDNWGDEVEETNHVAIMTHLMTALPCIEWVLARPFAHKTWHDL